MDKIVIKEIKVKPKRICQGLLKCNKHAECIFKMKHFGKLYLCEDCLKHFLKEVIDEKEKYDNIKRNCGGANHD